MITPHAVSQLVPAMPAAQAQRWAAALETARVCGGIDGHRQTAHWLGQLCHESAGLRHLEESLSYRAGRLMQVWPRRFATPEAARACARNPRALANTVYNGRMGNRSGSDDGWTFRGRGPIQLTGRDSYAALSRWLARVQPGAPDPVRQPDTVATPETGALAAAWFWSSRQLGALVARTPDEAAACAAVTGIINGGRTGLQDRLRWTRRALAITEGA